MELSGYIVRPLNQGVDLSSIFFPPSQPYTSSEIVPPSATEDSIDAQRRDADAEQTQILSTLMTRAKVLKCVSSCLLPITCPLTCVVGYLNMICGKIDPDDRLTLSIWGWEGCKPDEGDGTTCPGLDPWTPCKISTPEGLINSVASNAKKQRYRELHEMITRGRSALNHT